MSEEKKEAIEGILTEARVNEILGAALAGHSKRQMGAIEKLFADQLGKMLETKEPKPDAEQSMSAKAEVAALRKELHAEREAARNANGRNGLRERLAKKVRPELLDVAVGYLADSRKALRFDDEGNAILSVKRVRMNGTPAEELAFGLDEGVDEWLKTDEAKTFIPAPITARPTAGARPTAPVKTYDKAPVSDEERARRFLEMTESLGVETE